MIILYSYKFLATVDILVWHYIRLQFNFFFISTTVKCKWALCYHNLNKHIWRQKLWKKNPTNTTNHECNPLKSSKIRSSNTSYKLISLLLLINVQRKRTPATQLSLGVKIHLIIRKQPPIHENAVFEISPILIKFSFWNWYPCLRPFDTRRK